MFIALTDHVQAIKMYDITPHVCTFRSRAPYISLTFIFIYSRSLLASCYVYMYVLTPIRPWQEADEELALHWKTIILSQLRAM